MNSSLFDKVAELNKIMNKRYKIYQVDSFTNDKFCGNPAGVVSNADGLTDEQMQKIARELNNSETAFIFSPNFSDHDVWVRFFTPTVEVPSCGHATIAAHYVRAIENNLPFTDKFIFKAKQGEAIGRPGIVEVEVQIKEKNPAKVKIGGNAVIVYESEILI